MTHRHKETITKNVARTGPWNAARTKILNAYNPPALPWNGSKYMCTHRHDLIERTSAYSTTQHRVQTPHNMPQPAKNPTNNPSCQTTQPTKQPTHHSTNRTGNPIA